AASDRLGLAMVANTRAAVEVDLGDLAAAEEALEESRRIYLDLGNKQDLATVWNNLGIVNEMRGELTQADLFYQQCLGLSRELRDTQTEAYVLHSLGRLAWAQEMNDVAKQYLETSEALFNQIGDILGAARCRLTHGDVERARGQLHEASVMYEESMQ